MAVLIGSGPGAFSILTVAHAIGRPVRSLTEPFDSSSFEVGRTELALLEIVVDAFSLKKPNCCEKYKRHAPMIMAADIRVLSSGLLWYVLMPLRIHTQTGPQ